jgi:urease accessory protein
MPSWMILQLADSAFPTGGFVHSAGLEAAVYAGEVRGRDDVESFCGEIITQTAHGSLPIVGAAFDAPERLAEIDAFTTTTLWSQVAARASKAQGWALLDTARRAFADAEWGPSPFLHDLRKNGDGPHFAPAFGFVTRTLEVSRDDALATLLHLSVRGVLSAAIRLGTVGPGEAQAIHRRLHPLLDTALAQGRARGLDDVAQTAPLVELFQAKQDQLYSRLFQS